MICMPGASHRRKDAHARVCSWRRRPLHIAARSLAEAGDGRVVVTRTVRDLATGTDLAFTPLGSVGLRGVAGEWELFETSAG